MSLNIKSEEAHRLAREVAARTGETMTEAVITSLRERLGRIESAQEGSDERFDRLRAISLRTAPRMTRLPPSGEIGSLLYDERGLPA